MDPSESGQEAEARTPPEDTARPEGSGRPESADGASAGDVSSPASFARIFDKQNACMHSGEYDVILSWAWHPAQVIMR